MKSLPYCYTLNISFLFKLSFFSNKKGFIEATGKNSFFSIGKKNQWKEKLTKNQIGKIEKKFAKTMKKFNYKLAVEF